MVALVEAIREVEKRYVHSYFIDSSIQSMVNKAISITLLAVFVTTQEKLMRMVIYAGVGNTCEK